MKLKTHMSSCTGTPVPSVEWGSNLNASLGHDAMAAHALLQAMEEVAEFPDEMPDEMWELLRTDRDALTQAFRMTVRDTRDEIKQRADEILAGWMGEERG